MKHIVFITINKKSKLNGINRIYIGIHNTNPETSIVSGLVLCIPI